MQLRLHTRHALLALAATASFGALGAAPQPDARALRTGWEQANFAAAGKAQDKAILDLVKQCDEVLPASGDDGEILTWCGIINASYAGHAGPFSAMGYARAARSDLEQALQLAPGSFTAAAHTSLGTLYYKVPGWPVGFGDKDRARAELEAGLAGNPKDIDANFFMGDFLLQQRDYEAARRYLNLAASAADRPGREVADAGRRREIGERLALIDQHSAGKGDRE
ncbi:tetratricopeptide repeat protein [Haliea sp. E17]|uniref:tetratricopeptide repeat protein n=1 Tax=Haliea sp. E17 TaxID=3401576 RepID=UPI003AABF7AA